MLPLQDINVKPPLNPEIFVSVITGASQPAFIAVLYLAYDSVVNTVLVPAFPVTRINTPENNRAAAGFLATRTVCGEEQLG